ncbi:MAG: tetratricopeptide repeat protein [Acetobacteraceae bacterium]|nr:tetratricopeptide repeat protein [Acetobacteraceae bacterium]
MRHFVLPLLLALAPGLAAAQPTGDQPPGTQLPGTQPPGTLPPGTLPLGQPPTGSRPPASQASGNKAADRAALLDALHAAPDETLAVHLEARLREMWLEAGSPAVTLLMSRGLRALNAGQSDDAIEAFTDALTLDPNLAAAYHQRALARFHAGDTQGAIRDIEETLKREPRDFAAFRSLSEIAAAREDWKGAYAAWQKLLEIDPKTPGGDAKLRDLKRRAFGEEA